MTNFRKGIRTEKRKHHQKDDKNVTALWDRSVLVLRNTSRSDTLSTRAHFTNKALTNNNNNIDYVVYKMQLIIVAITIIVITIALDNCLLLLYVSCLDICL